MRLQQPSCLPCPAAFPRHLTFFRIRVATITEGILALDAALSPTVSLRLPSSSLMKQKIEWGVPSSGTLHSYHLLFVANVLRQPIGSIFKGQAVEEEMDCLTFEDG